MRSAEIARKSGSNFLSSFWFLPKEKRQALETVYAYCRLTDDLVDLVEPISSPEQSRESLERWRKETMRALQGKGGSPVLLELAAVVERHSISHDLLHQLVDGVKMDLDRRRYLHGLEPDPADRDESSTSPDDYRQCG